MSKSFYLGIRIEIANKLLIKDLKKKYNLSHDTTQIFDLYKNGKITIEKKNSMLIARGAKDRISTGLVNFSIMAEMHNDIETERVVKIVNVLGNDRLVREKISLFVSGKSLLNAIPEFKVLQEALVNLDSMMPGFIRLGWYYAPEARFKL